MTNSHDQDLKRTPLGGFHARLNAKIVPFAGYAMPLHYEEGIITEHAHTRERVSLFDVSHMGQAILRGPDPAAALETLVPGDIKDLPTGKIRYTVLTDDQGGILDDLMVGNRGRHLFLVVNASRKEHDFRHIADRLKGRAELEILPDHALLALQGPLASQVMGRLSPPARHMMFMTCENLNVAGMPCCVARSGYTGEDGYEISVAAEHCKNLAHALIEEPEVRPAGLGARDTLRLEAGLSLYGNDIDETTTPVEAGLTWVIGKRRREEGGFPGAAVILRQLAEGAARRLVGLKPEGRAPARAGTVIVDDEGREIGKVTSGGYGPTVGGPIAMGYVATGFAQAGKTVQLVVRGKNMAAQVVKLPFVPHHYFKA